MSFLRHNGFRKYQRAAQKQPSDLTFSSAVKLSLAGCSKASPASVLPDITNVKMYSERVNNLHIKQHHFCPLERNV